MSAPSDGPDVSLTDDEFLAQTKERFEAEQVEREHFAQTCEINRLFVRHGWDRVAGKTTEPSSLTWSDLEAVTGLTRSGLRSRAMLGTGVGPGEARRLKQRAAREARDQVNNPGAHDPATVTAAARLLGIPVSTFRREVLRGKVAGNDAGLVPAPEGGWPVPKAGIDGEESTGRDPIAGL